MPSFHKLCLLVSVTLCGCSGDLPGVDESDDAMGGAGGEAGLIDSDTGTRDLDSDVSDALSREPTDAPFAPPPPNPFTPPPPGPPQFNVTLATDPVPATGSAGCNDLGKLTPGTVRYAVVLSNQTPGTNTITVTTPGTVQLNSTCKTLTFTDDTNFVGRFDFWITAPTMGAGDLVRIHGTSSAKTVKAYYMQLQGSNVGGANNRRGIRVVNGSLGLYASWVKGMFNPIDEGTAGAGVLVKQLAAGEVGSLLIEQTLIEKNKSTGIPNGRGAGLYFTGNGTLVVTDSLFANNDAHASGGAIQYAATTAPTAYIKNTTITGNYAQLEGGGIGISSPNTAQLRIQNSSISNNSVASGKGAGIVIEGGANVVIESVTMLENLAQSPYDGTQIHMKAPAAVVVATSQLFGKSPVCGGPAASQMSGPSNIRSDNSCNLNGIANSTQWVPALANNGSGCNGPHFQCLTHKVTPPSQAIDLSANCLSEDQRHKIRSGPLCWAGSYED